MAHTHLIVRWTADICSEADSKWLAPSDRRLVIAMSDDDESAFSAVRAGVPGHPLAGANATNFWRRCGGSPWAGHCQIVAAGYRFAWSPQTVNVGRPGDTSLGALEGD
jgi:hypothetical protein